MKKVGENVNYTGIVKPIWDIDYMITVDGCDDGTVVVRLNTQVSSEETVIASITNKTVEGIYSKLEIIDNDELLDYLCELDSTSTFLERYHIDKALDSLRKVHRMPIEYDGDTEISLQLSSCVYKNERMYSIDIITSSVPDGTIQQIDHINFFNDLLDGMKVYNMIIRYDKVIDDLIENAIKK